MNIRCLKPCPPARQNFRRDRQQFIPATQGCYALATFQGIVLYVGLTKDLRRRFGEHLDDPKKTSSTDNGRAFFFYWLECDELEKIERTWQNKCEITDGALPVLNKASSPISI